MLRLVHREKMKRKRKRKREMTLFVFRILDMHILIFHIIF